MRMRSRSTVLVDLAKDRAAVFTKSRKCLAIVTAANQEGYMWEIWGLVALNQSWKESSSATGLSKAFGSLEIHPVSLPATVSHLCLFSTRVAFL